MRLRTLVITLVVVAVLCGGALAGFWYYAAGELTKGIAAWQDDWRALGGTADFPEPPVGGFPIELTAEFAQPVLALPSGEIWRGPAKVTGRAWLWQLETIRFVAPGHHELDLPQGRLALDAATLAGSVAFADGLLDRLTLRLTQGQLRNSGTGQQILLDALDLQVGPLRPLQGKAYAIGFDGDLQGLPLPPDAAVGIALLGPRLEQLHLVGTLTGPLALEAAPRAAAALWRDGQGQLQLTQIELRWGDFRATGSGSLTLDQGFRPLGSIQLQTAGLLQLVQRMDQAGLFDSSVAPALLAALKALATGQDSNGRDLVPVTLSARDGVLSLGVIPLGQLRPLF